MDPTWNVEVLRAARTRCGADWRWQLRPGPRNYLNFWLIVAGRGTLRTEGRRFDLVPGDCFVQKMWEMIDGEHDPEQPLDVLWANHGFRDRRGRMVDHSRHASTLPPLHRRMDDLSFCVSLAERMVHAASRADGRSVEADQWMGAILCEIRGQDARPRLSGPALDQFKTVRALCARIRARPDQPYQIAALARECHCTPGHFTRIFRRFTGRTPRAFIVGVRIEAAKGLLRASSHDVGRIAEMLGFYDIYHFSRRFRQIVGRSPSEYRRQ